MDGDLTFLDSSLIHLQPNGSISFLAYSAPEIIILFLPIAAGITWVTY